MCYAGFVATTRNLTLSLPVDLIHKAKTHAASRHTSINRLVRELLEEAVEGEDRQRRATAKILAIARRGPHFTKDPGPISREEIHERW